MKRLITTTLFVSLGMNASIFAGHTRSSIHRDYEVQRVELQNEYQARREANEYQFHRDRDILRVERSRAARLDCHETRAYRLRAINRELSALSRDFGVRNRGLASWYHRERELLRENYELALHNTRVSRPVIVERPFVAAQAHVHPADCECSVCNRPRPDPPACGPTGEACSLGLEGARYVNDHRSLEAGYRTDPRGFERVNYRNNRRSVDWASLVLSLLVN